MEDQEKWGLSREEIEAQLAKLSIHSEFFSHNKTSCLPSKVGNRHEV